MTAGASIFLGVVPAKAGTHTPRPRDLALWVDGFITTNAGGYGSLLSQGRQAGVPPSRFKQPNFVIAGLDPAIHPLRKRSSRRWMDARIKSGHDISFVDTASRSRRVFCASFAGKFLSSETQRAQGIPGARCAR